MHYQCIGNRADSRWNQKHEKQPQRRTYRTRNGGRELVVMTYADPGRRRDLITGLRALADFLEGSPQIPAPCCVDVLVFPPNVPGQDGRAEIDRIAVLTGARID